jgi:hypothetical protein
LNEASIVWDKEPNRTDAPRVTSAGDMGGLLTERLTGKSNVTNHTVMIWDRDYATRWLGDPEQCPSENNWVAMPTNMDSVKAKYPRAKKVEAKLRQFDEWIGMCGPNGTKRMT